MSRHSTEHPNQPLEARLTRAAGRFPYPPTPDLRAGVRQRLAGQPVSSRPAVARPGWVALIVILIAAILLAVPPVRAALAEVLRLGAVRIFLIEPTPTQTPPPVTASPETPPTATPRPTPTPLASILNLAGETTLAQAQAEVEFPIRLPTKPLDLGPPDRVYLQDFEGPLIVLVWLDPNQPERVRLSLHQLGAGTFAGKVAPEVIEETEVNGTPALWLEGPHFFQLRDGSFGLRRLVEGNVLLWVEDNITYRLETDLSLEETIRMAESLQ